MTMNAPSASTISPTPYRLKTPARVPAPASGHATTASAASVTPKSRPRPTPSVHCAGLYDRSSSGPSSTSTATQPSRHHYLYPGCDPLRPPTMPLWRVLPPGRWTARTPRAAAGHACGPARCFSCSCTLVAGYSGRSAVVGPTVYKRIHLKKKTRLIDAPSAGRHVLFTSDPDGRPSAYLLAPPFYPHIGAHPGLLDSPGLLMTLRTLDALRSGVFFRLCTLLAGYSGRRVVVGPAAFKRIHHEKKKPDSPRSLF